jgi:hypothetical protein
MSSLNTFIITQNAKKIKTIPRNMEHVTHNKSTNSVFIQIVMSYVLCVV